MTFLKIKVNFIYLWNFFLNIQNEIINKIIILNLEDLLIEKNSFKKIQDNNTENNNNNTKFMSFLQNVMGNTPSISNLNDLASKNKNPNDQSK